MVTMHGIAEISGDPFGEVKRHGRVQFPRPYTRRTELRLVEVDDLWRLSKDSHHCLRLHRCALIERVEHLTDEELEVHLMGAIPEGPELARIEKHLVWLRAELCGDSSIAAVKSTDQRCPDDSSLPFHLPRSWAVLRERQMRSGACVVREIGPKDPLQVPSIEHDHMIEAFAPNGSNQPFDNAVLPWARGSRHDLLDVETRQLIVHALPYTRSRSRTR